MSNRNGESGQPCLVPKLSRKAFNFTFEYDVFCGFVIYGIYYVEVCPFYAQFVEFLSYKDVKFCQMMLNLSLFFQFDHSTILQL